jgi:hypothetical protein
MELGFDQVGQPYAAAMLGADSSKPGRRCLFLIVRPATQNTIPAEAQIQKDRRIIW